MFSIMRFISFLLIAIGIFLIFWSLFGGSLDKNSDFIKWIFGISFGGKVLQSFAENLSK
jgi:hypothetical protein